MSNYKTWFKRIRMAFELNRREVVEIMKIGGMPVSSSHIDGWARPGNDAQRSRPMTEAEFDAFTFGLVEWSKREDKT